MTPRTFTKVLVAPMGPTLFGRHTDSIPAQEDSGNACATGPKHIDQLWMADQLLKKSTHAYSDNDISWGIIQHPRESSITSTRKDPYINVEGKEGIGKLVHASIRLSKSPGIPLVMHTNGEMGQVEFMGIPTRFPITVEEEAPRPDDTDPSHNEVQPLVVDETIQPSGSLPPWAHLMDHSYSDAS